MMRKLKVLVVCGNDADATSFYRGLTPMAVLAKQFPDLVEIVHPWGDFSFNQNRLRLVDVVFIQRPGAEFHMQLVQLARALKIPVWCDIDDNLFAIPEHHPLLHTYNAQGVQRLAAFCLQHSDVVTVTTEALKEAVTQFNPNVEVIPNAFDDLLLGKDKRDYLPSPGRKPILWRGPPTHMHDLMTMIDPNDESLKPNDEWKWIFFGFKPWFLTEGRAPDTFAHFSWQESVPDYFETLNRIQPKIVVVPLADTPFNRCKSNNAWIEATFANAVVVAPYWEEWKMPGVLNYLGKEDFHAAIRVAMTADLAVHQAASWKYIQDNLTLTKVNLVRLKVLERWM